MLDKSIVAMLAAIEVYNKPTFSFREESFSILAVNAWELLFMRSFFISPEKTPQNYYITEALAKPLAISAYGGHREGFCKSLSRM